MLLKPDIITVERLAQLDLLVDDEVVLKRSSQGWRRRAKIGTPVKNSWFLALTYERAIKPSIGAVGLLALELIS